MAADKAYSGFDFTLVTPFITVIKEAVHVEDPVKAPEKQKTKRGHILPSSISKQLIFL